jgi:Protein of unknown function (DUF2917)
METTSKTIRVKLAKNEVLKLNDAAGSRITCHIGTVLITQEGDSRDINLASGESFALECSGLSLILAANRAHIGIEAYKVCLGSTA